MIEKTLDEILEGNVDEVRNDLRDREDEGLDYEKIKEKEKEGKDRKTVKKFLDKRIKEESSESSSKQEGSDEQASEDSGEEASETESEGSENSGSDEASGMAAKLQGPLEDLEDVSSIRGAAVVRRDGLLIASNMDSDIDDDQVGAMTASTVGSGETASDALSMGEVDEVTVESDNGKLIATGAGEQGILAVLADSDVNIGLVKVEIEEAVEKTKKVL